MFLVDDAVRWSASDLTAAVRCEYAVLRTLDYRLHRAEPINTPADAFLDHLAAVGLRHEENLLAERMAEGSVVALESVARPYTAALLEEARAATLRAFENAPDAIYQATFYDHEFFGYADFVESTENGWLVCDAKLARSAKPQALLQVGAYADQIEQLGLPLSSRVALLLGSGERAEFPIADVLPAFREARKRFRALLASHQGHARPVEWGDDSVLACGKCAECIHAAAMSNDVSLVAGLRMDQRRKLRGAGIVTMGDLAVAVEKPAGMAQATFQSLRSQAAMQWRQLRQGPSAPTQFELRAGAGETLARLPAPSAGDFFFDFEGDPLYEEGDASRTGLEYLWGVMRADGSYHALWAHSSDEERQAFVDFLRFVAETRAVHPDMHIYHYAPYETTALKRLAMRYQTHEDELDDLLRAEVFVDLYATVRGSVRVSAPSYSIKKLEPLYMGAELRDDDAIQAGDASILAYHRFRGSRVDDSAAAKQLLKDLQDYNEYDCLSTLRLRDWLLHRAEQAGVRDQIVAQAKEAERKAAPDHSPLFETLMSRSGPAVPSHRTPGEQTYAMLATSLGYFRREDRQFWWDHFERLSHPAEDWSNSRDVFVVESVELVQDWEVPEGRGSNARRVLRLVGDWSPGSKASSRAQVAYATPAPPKAFGPDRAPYAACDAHAVEPDPGDPRVVLLTESYPPEGTFAHLPVALVPARPPDTANLEAAVQEICARAVDTSQPPASAVLDLLVRRAPRLHDGVGLQVGGSTLEDAVAALTSMSDSYLAIQGPPGTGKTYTGSRVVKELVERHGWRIGVVAQSHAVVENMLGSIVEAGLDPALVGKGKTENPDPTWTPLSNVRRFLDRAERGCVVGGTAWDFANDSRVPRGTLDLLVVDEAGQFALAPTMAVSVAAQRLLLLGDPQQLPQVSQGTHAEPINESALGWLMDGRDTIPVDLGYFLDTSYRMHPDLCERVSVLSYDGRLGAAVKAEARRLDGADPGLLVVELEHTGNRTESPEEAAAVVQQVTAHMGLWWSDPNDSSTPRRLTECDVLVVAPYNAQVALIRDALKAAGLTEVRVGTVDKFQGQEAPVAIVSMTASSHGDVPRGMGFLLSRNRVNVAVSRAQWRAIVVRSSALTSFMPSTVTGVLELGAFVGLCEPASSSP